MSAPSPVNVLFIFTDQLRADAIAGLGNDVIRTPNLDRLVREGTAFTNCYSPSPVCVPARCCLHYGQYATKTGLATNGPMMDDNGCSYPAVLGEQGYRTHAVGKCHFTPDKKALRGFQSRQTQEEIQADPAEDDYIAWLHENGYDYYEAHGARGEMYYVPQVSTLPAEAHPTQWVGSESVRFIEENAGAEQPWLLFSSFIHPHPPFAPPKPWHRLYRTKDMPEPFLPDDLTALQTWVNRHQNRTKYRDRGLDIQLIRTITAYYYAAVSFIDFQVGRMLDALEESGQLDKTLILFSADHGEYRGDYGCFGKRGMHDVSARVPMLARLPGRFPQGERCSTATSLVDAFPTILGAAGLSREGLDIDGKDLAEIAQAPDPERVVHSQFGNTERGIYMAATENWKYIYSAGEKLECFVDRQADPKEAHNRASDPALAGPREALREKLLEYLEAEGAHDVVERQNGELRWKDQPPSDDSFLDDPNAGLLLQDYPSYPTNLPGYSDV